jgi:hypothetical protein
MDAYRHVKVWPATHYKLRLIAAQTGESIIQALDRMVLTEEVRLKEQAKHGEAKAMGASVQLKRATRGDKGK